MKVNKSYSAELVSSQGHELKIMRNTDSKELMYSFIIEDEEVFCFTKDEASDLINAIKDLVSQ